MQKNLLIKTPKNRAKDFFSWWAALIFLASALLFVLWVCSHFVIQQKIPGLGLLLIQGELSQILSPKTGTVSSWVVEEGDHIKKGQLLALVQDHADPSQSHNVFAHMDGVVAEIIAYANTVIEKGHAMALISSHGDVKKDLELLGFVSSLEGKKIKPGMKAIIDPTVTDPYVHGHLLATVKRVGRLPMTKAAILSVVKIPEVANFIRDQINAEPFVVTLSLTPDENHETGYGWSGPGPRFALDSGIFGYFNVIYDEPTVLALLWPSLFRRLGDN